MGTYFDPWLTYLVVGNQPKCDGGDIEAVGDKVHNVPHVVDVLT